MEIITISVDLKVRKKQNFTNQNWLDERLCGQLKKKQSHMHTIYDNKYADQQAGIHLNQVSEERSTSVEELKEW